MKHYGDITKIKGADVPPVNVVIGGSPCQDLSVAGKRAGLAGERSGLFMEQLRIIKEMRYADEFIRGREGNNIRPRFMVWENVPGAFSSNKGEDFGAVLQETIHVVYKEAPPIPMPKNGWPNAGCLQLSNVGGQCSIAWRVLDAQFWGVPQRRRRIALVADFGGMCAGEILFERKGMSGYSSQSGSAWKTTPAYAETSPLRDDYILGAKGSGNPITLKDGQPIAYSFDSMASNSMKSNNPKSGCREVDRSKTLDTSTPDPSKNQGGIAIVEAVNAKGIVCMATQQGGAEIREDDKAPTLTAAAGMSGNNQPVICIQGNCIDRADTAGCNGKGWTENVSYTLNTIDRPAVTVAVAGGLSYKQGAKAHSIGYENGKSPTLLAARHDASVVIAIDNHPQDSRVKLSDDGIVQTLNGKMGTGGNNTPMVLVTNAERIKMDKNSFGATHTMTITTGNNMEIRDNQASTLRFRDYKDAQCVSYGINGDKAGTLDGNYYKGCGEREGIEREVVAQLDDQQHYIVRRLTPLECERLQGFPDSWTNIGKWVDEKGKDRECTDGARYKALGNSIAIPPWFYVLQRLSLACGTDKTMASLFDGIGGFPLIWEGLHGEGSCVWASEIEEFPITVTKEHFSNGERSTDRKMAE